MPLPTPAVTKELKPGAEVILIDPRLSSNGEKVSVAILSDNEAKVLVKTKGSDYRPGTYIDNGKPGAAWYGAMFLSCGDNKDEATHDNTNLKRKQRTFSTREQTIFVSGIKRVAWRPK